MYKCEECNLEFETFQAKANHHRWKHLGYLFKNEETNKQAQINYKKADELRFGKIIEEDVICSKCGINVIHVIYRKDKKKDRYYCSRECANSHIRTKESKKKVSDTQKQKIRNGEKLGFIKSGSILNEDREQYCKNCGIKIKGKNRVFCSPECRKKNIRKDIPVYRNYKQDCQFTFALNDYPNEFDFSLIEKYGWYKAKNRGNNTNGISRDHMFSIKEGFLQNIDPKIISHPANCKLMRHNDNISKYTKCSLTLDELLKRIEEWNKKYPIR